MRTQGAVLAMVAACAMLVAGCASKKYWYRDGVGADQCDMDIAWAQAEAAKFTTGYGTQNPFIIADQRNEIFSASMRSKGYRLLSAEELSAAGAHPTR